MLAKKFSRLLSNDTKLYLLSSIKKIPDGYLIQMHFFRCHTMDNRMTTMSRALCCQGLEFSRLTVLENVSNNVLPFSIKIDIRYRGIETCHPREMFDEDCQLKKSK